MNTEVPRSAPIDLTPVTTSQPSPPDPDETPSPAPLTPTSPPANNDTVWWIIILSLFLLFLLVVLVFICCIVRLRNENKKLQKTKSLQPTRYIEMTPQSPNSRGLSRSLPPSPMPLTSSDFDAKGLPPNFNDSANGLTAYTDSVNGLRETAGECASFFGTLLARRRCGRHVARDQPDAVASIHVDADASGRGLGERGGDVRPAL